VDSLQITINDEKIDYTLENEKNLYEVLASLRRWLESEGFVLTEARSDTRELDLSAEEELKAIAINSIGILHIGAQTAVEKQYKDLAAIAEFLAILKRGVGAGDSKAVKTLLRDYPYLRDGLDGVLARHGLASTELNAAALDSRIAESGILETGEAKGETRKSLFAFIETATAAIVPRMREIENPAQELSRDAEQLKQSVGQLSEVSVMLQTGRDQEAMAVIVRFVELSTKITRLYPILKQAGSVDYNKVVVEGVSFPEFYAEFNTILGELIDAFTAEDSVLIGDLLEYEISPRLEKLKNYIDLLTEG